MGRFQIFTVLAISAFIIFGASYLYCESEFCLNIDAPAKYSGPVEKITIANIGEFSIFNLIAEDRGYFSDRGLDAEMLDYSSGPPAVADLLAGKVDFAVAADFVGVRNIFSNKNLRILAQLNKHYTFEVIGRMDRGIAAPADLRGKKIGVTRKGVGEFFLGRFLSFNGLNLEDVSIFDLQAPDIVSQLNSGKIDAAVIFNPHAYELKKTLRGNAVFWSAQDDQRVYALLYGTEEFLRAHPDIAARYVSALFEAEKFLKENANQAKSILSEYTGYDTEYVDGIWPNFDFTLSLDQSLFLSMEDQARFIIDNSLVSDKDIPNYLNFIYFDALEGVSPARISIIR